tara:strand:+ start:190 stop:339 length:150 start_codon:yes stop_codon:yes gene_type:complete
MVTIKKINSKELIKKDTKTKYPKNDPYGLVEAWWKIFTKNYKPTLFIKK